MFKLMVLSLLCAFAAAKPSAETKIELPAATTLLHLTPTLGATTIVHEPALAKVGDVVSSVPTSISHQSSTIVHDRADVVTPLVAPAIKTTHYAPLLRSYADHPVTGYQYHPVYYYYPQHYTYAY